MIKTWIHLSSIPKERKLLPFEVVLRDLKRTLSIHRSTREHDPPLNFLLPQMRTGFFLCVADAQEMPVDLTFQCAIQENKRQDI